MKYLIGAAVASLLIALGFFIVHWHTPTATAPPLTQPTANFQRFLPYPQATGLALDTKTGLLCHTFNEKADTYVPTGRSRTPGVVVGPEITMGHYALDSIPLCVLLSQNEAETIEEVNALNATAQTK
jgi:hypothetical protein